jgi:hypothetical protein
LSSVLQLVPLPAPAYRIPVDLEVTQAVELTSLPRWLAEHGPKVVAVVTHSYHGMAPELWGLLPTLRLVANFGVGLDRIDLAQAHSSMPCARAQSRAPASTFTIASLMTGVSFGISATSC